jgi:hypothetical protein
MDTETRELNIISPTRGVPYTIKQALKKGLERGAVWGTITTRDLGGSEYDDHDIIVICEDLGPAESQWSRSIMWRFNGQLEGHFTNRRDFHWEWAAYSDGETTDPSLISPGEITFWLQVNAEEVVEEVVCVADLTWKELEVLREVVLRVVVNAALWKFESRQYAAGAPIYRISKFSESE